MYDAHKRELQSHELLDCSLLFQELLKKAQRPSRDLFFFLFVFGRAQVLGP